jgi:uncharacterized protein (DUF1015 family)
MNRDPHNIVRLILPQSQGPSDAYAAAANHFGDWMSKGIMTIHSTPAMYVWEQEYYHEATAFKRRALVTKVNCDPYRVGGVMGHELTHAGPKEGRLNLFKATGAQFSQIFSIFEDKDRVVATYLNKATTANPLFTAKGDDGHTSRLYYLDDASIIELLQKTITDKTILIADGHHRYETSVAYYQEQGITGTTLMTLVPVSDPGLIVLPTHRVISLPVTVTEFKNSLPKSFSADTHDQTECAALFEEAADNPDKGVLVAVAPGEGKALRIQWDRDAVQPMKESYSPRLNSDAVILHEYILPSITELRHDSLECFYFHQAADTVNRAGEMNNWAFLLRPTTTATLLEMAE